MSHLRPNQTATPMDPAMVNAIPENRKKELGGVPRLGEGEVKCCGVIPRLAAERSPSERFVACRGRHL
jgi:hypothetical protein